MTGSESPSFRGRLTNTRDLFHQLAHEGKIFVFSHIFEAVDDDAVATVLVRNGKYELHLEPAAAAGGKAYVSLLERVTASDEGSPITLRNLNREIALEMDASQNEGTWVRAYHSVTLSDNGTEIRKKEIFAASQTVAKVSGGEVRSGLEWVIGTGELYAIQVQNKSGSAVDIEIEGIVYEHKEQD